MRQRDLHPEDVPFTSDLSRAPAQHHPRSAPSGPVAAGCLSDHLDLVPRQNPSPEELANRLLGCETSGEVKLRSAPGPAIRPFGRSEKPLFEAGVTGKSCPEPLDFHQIETDEGSIHVYSTVTVLARLRG